MRPVRALVLTGFGINCEEEMAAAYRLAGAEASIAHLNELFLERIRLQDFDILNFPGGFSFGDDLGSGKVLANKLRYKRLSSGKLFFDDLQSFLKDGKHVLGVCNGFQALVKMGLLPNIGGSFEQEVTLTRNDSGIFEDRWVGCATAPLRASPFLTGIGRIRLPVRHGEGKLVIRDDRIRKEIVSRGLNCLSYCDESGRPTQRYPDNPNGAELACAALSDASGQVLGIMPHPEAYLSFYNDPSWPQLRRSGQADGDAGEGLRIFQNIVRHVAGKRGE
jgi:phosphoribosylformylglycinamidine synthase